MKFQAWFKITPTRFASDMTPVVHVSFESVTDEFAFSVTCVEMIQLCGYTNKSQLKVMEWMGNIKQYRNHV